MGLAAGFLGGCTSMGGPPVVPFLANQDTPRDVFRANIVSYFFVVNCVAIAVYALTDMLHAQLLVRTLALAPLMLVGTLAYVRLARVVPERVFQRLVSAIVAAMGAVLFATNVPKLFT